MHKVQSCLGHSVGRTGHDSRAHSIVFIYLFMSEDTMNWLWSGCHWGVISNNGILLIVVYHHTDSSHTLQYCMFESLDALHMVLQNGSELPGNVKGNLKWVVWALINHHLSTLMLNSPCHEPLGPLQTKAQGKVVRVDRSETGHPISLIGKKLHSYMLKFHRFTLNLPRTPRTETS